MNIKQSIGQFGEDYAIRLYKESYYTIIARNLYNHRGKRLGELDFVAVKGKKIVFVEVKTRTSVKFGEPEVSVTNFKQRKIVRAVQWFLNKYPKYSDFQPQIDVCALLLDISTSQFNQSNLDKLIKYVKIYSNAVEMN